jgi:hypothetical protein
MHVYHDAAGMVHQLHLKQNQLNVETQSVGLVGLILVEKRRHSVS